MSIPKEPRQLMINLMYLVLMALLALNVSAKIFKAFEKVDHSLERSNEKLVVSNTQTLPEAIKEAAKKDKKYDVYVEHITPLRDLTQGFVDYVQEIEDKLIDEAGDKDGSHNKDQEGDYIFKKGHWELVGKKDKDVTTRLLVADVNNDEDGMGDELKKRILKAREEYVKFFDDEDAAKATGLITLDISEDLEAVEADPEVKTWAQYNFFQMPLAATLPIFEKIRNDAISTENGILNYFNEKVGGKDIVLSNFQVVSSPEKTYVIQGEKFSTNVFLSASAGETSNTGITIKVNGATIPVEEGVANWSQMANSPGIKKYSAAITVTNPVTGESETYERDFEYEVGLRSVTVSADKMNVFYIGVDNPITVSAAGVPTASLKVSAAGDGGLNLKAANGSSYTATVEGPPTGVNKFAYVVVSGEGLEPTRFPFRVKRIPNPTARLGGTKEGGNLGNGEFKAQRGLIAILDDFDFDARCDVVGFELTRQARNSDPVSAVNRGGTYDDQAMRLVQLAKPGDTYYFDNVRAKCPGDKAARQINQMVFKIK